MGRENETKKSFKKLYQLNKLDLLFIKRAKTIRM